MKAYPVEAPGKVGAGTTFCKVKKADKPNAGPGCDGSTIDEKGNVYLCTALGLQVFDSKGAALGVIEIPEQPANCTFGGADGKTLYVTARTSLYSVPMLVKGHWYARATSGANADGVIRIRAGSKDSFTDAQGNVWLGEEGFQGGDIITRAGKPEIANTDDDDLYRTEHYSMDSFSRKLANGNYTVKLHFAETYEDITKPGERVFSYSVNGKEFKDFDICAKAGGTLRPYIETVDVKVTDGELSIMFTPKVQNPAINGIEIIPAK